MIGDGHESLVVCGESERGKKLEKENNEIVKENEGDAPQQSGNTRWTMLHTPFFMLDSK